MNRSLCFLMFFYLWFSTLHAKGLYPYAAKANALRPFDGSILLKEYSTNYLLKKKKSAKASVNSFRALQEALAFDVSHDMETSIPDFFKKLEVEIRLDSINWTEFASKNNQAKALWMDLKKCSKNEDPTSFYFKYDFKQCPELETRINEFRRSLVDLLLNTNYRAMDKVNSETIFYSVESKTGLELSKSFLDGVKLEYNPIHYSLESKLIFNEKPKYQGDYIGHVTSFSELFRKHYPRTKNLIDPFFIQILIEMSSFLNYPKYAAYLDEEGKPKPGIFMGMSSLTRIKDVNVPVEVPSVFEFDLNNFYRALMTNKKASFIRTEFGELYQEADETARLYLFHNSRPMFSTFVNEDAALAVDDYFPANYILFSKVGLSSLRLLSNLSFLIEPDSFGLVPNQNFLFFVASSREFIFSESPIQYLSKWIAGNLTDYYYPRDCHCRKLGIPLKTNEFEALSMLTRFRFYLSQSFDDMIGLELKE